MQIRLSTDDDYRQIVTILSNLGFSLQHQPARPGGDNIHTHAEPHRLLARPASSSAVLDKTIMPPPTYQAGHVKDQSRGQQEAHAHIDTAQSQTLGHALSIEQPSKQYPARSRYPQILPRPQSTVAKQQPQTTHMSPEWRNVDHTMQNVPTIESIQSRLQTGMHQNHEPPTNFLVQPNLHTRPSTAPVDNRPERVSQVLPQKRLLPFEDLGVSRSGSSQDGNTLRPTSSTLDLPPLPTPRLFEQRSALGSDISSSGLDLPHDRPRTRNGWHSRDVLQEIDGNALRGSMEPRQNWSTHGSTRADRVDFDLSNRSTSSGRTEQAQVPGQRMHLLSDLARDAETLGNYANVQKSARLASIQDMICRYINDDSFLVLCQDVESSWQRIGLEQR